MQCVRKILLAVTCVAALTACSATRESIVNSDLAATDRGYDFHFFPNEPFAVSPGNTLTVDVAIPKHKIHPALVILLHGNHSRKEAHRNQLLALAGSGFAALAMQFPNAGQWHDNAETLAKALPILKRGFSVRGVPVRIASTVLVGHSFGGYAAAVAAGLFPAVRGVILLDPAMYSPKGLGSIAKIKAPVILIGADKQVFRSRKRDLFFESIRGKAIEFSVRGATHDDAQNPSMFALSSHGIDPYTSRPNQEFITRMVVEGAKALTAKYQLPRFADRLRALEKVAKITDVKVRSNSGIVPAPGNN
jgi:pimeloyl-ACP methyl ester carboxylesterase